MHPMFDTLPSRLAGDLDGAFPDLVRVAQDGLYAGALRLLGNPADAEEVAQEAFIRAYRALQDYSPERIGALRIRPWLWTIAANLCRNRLRSRARRPVAPMDGVDVPDRSDGPETAALGALAGETLAAHLLALPWPMRTAVVLRHIADLSPTEVSEALDRPLGTVKADIHRGLARLRDSLREEEA